MSGRGVTGMEPGQGIETEVYAEGSVHFYASDGAKSHVSMFLGPQDARKLGLILLENAEDAEDAEDALADPDPVLTALKELVERRRRAGGGDGSDGRYTRARAAIAWAELKKEICKPPDRKAVAVAEASIDYQLGKKP